uniref:Ribonuclease H-like domain, reverse transcriptase, RNA-dependent DNA polymerase n=1 Tax=Tanacetum cinerariifolium TaxID=118510 RepID=A0A699HGD4_TANCI|nr:ribonuclease H-like domain, reverse transcriptase, RNA-dependent DNA polymerase [Tanacetum cinerariifolium]
MVSFVKLPILKKGEYILWTMKMEQYLAHTDYSLWEVILNGNSAVQMTKDKAESTGSTNKLNVAYSISSATGHSSQTQGSPSYADELMFLFFANQSSSPQLNNEDLEQINQYDLEKMELKWQVAMLSMRVKRFYKKTGRKLEFNRKERVGFDKIKVECFNCHRRGHFARDFRSARNSGNMSRDAGNAGYIGRNNEEEATDFALMAFTSNPLSSSISNSERKKLKKANLEIISYQYGLESTEGQLRVHQQNEVIYEEKIGVLEYAVKDKSNLLKYTKKQLDEALKEIEDLKAKLKKFKTSSKNLTKLLDSQISAKVKTGLGYDSQFNEKEVLVVKEEEVTETVFDNRSSDEENILANNRFKKGEGYHAVPPPLTGNYMPPKSDLSFPRLDDSIYTFKISKIVTSVTKDKKDAPGTSTACIDKPKEDRSSASLIQDWDTDSDNDNVFSPEHIPAKIYFVKTGETIKHVKPVKSIKPVKPIKPVQTDRMAKKSVLPNNVGKGIGHKESIPVWNNVQRTNQQNKFAPTAVFTRFGRIPVSAAKPKVTASTSMPNQLILLDLNKGHPQQALKNKRIIDKVKLSAKSSDYQAADDKPKGDIGSKTVEEPVNMEYQAYRDELDRLISQEKEVSDAANALRKGSEQGCINQRGATNAGSTNPVNTISNLVNVASTSGTFTVGGPSYPHPNAFIPANTLLHFDQDDSQISDLEDTAEFRSNGIFNSTYDDDLDIFTSPVQSVGAEADFNNIDSSTFFSLIPTHRVYSLVDLPYGKKSIRTKWVYKNKKDKRGIIVRNKARLVAQGHRQEEGIDYDEVFAPVAKIEAIRIFLAFASFMRFIVYQMNVKSALLYGTIEEEVDSLFDLESYSNSDYAGANLDRKPTTGGCQFLGKRLISWQCKKQTIVSTSTTEAEYVAAANCCGQNLVYHSKTKHIDSRHHFIRDSYEKKLIQVLKIHTDEPLNDVYVTPTLTKKVFSNMIRKSKKISGTVTLLFATMLAPPTMVEGEGSRNPPESQPTPSLAQPINESQIPESLSSPQNTQSLLANLKGHCNITKTQSKATLNEPTPQGEGSGSGPGHQETMGGYTVRSGEDRMEHDIELTDPVAQTPHDLPLSGGHTHGIDKGSMTLKELTDLCTTLLQKVLDLENVKTAQAKKIASLKKRINKLEQRQSSRFSGFHPFRAGASKRNSLDKDDDTEMIVEDREVSTAEPKTPPITINLFDDEDVTIVDTLVKMKNQKAKKKGIAFKDDKGKGILQESEPAKKTKKKDHDQIKRDAEVVLKIQAHLNEKARIERERQEEASKAALCEMYDEVQVQIDVNHELAVRLTLEEQEKYIVEERSKLLAEFFERRKKQLAKERTEAIRSKPPTKTQLKSLMMTYLKHTGRFTHAQLKSMSFEEIQKLYIKEQKWVVPDDDKAIDYETLDVKAQLLTVFPLIRLRSHGFIVDQAALKVVSCKVTKHEKACIENQHVFIPFAFETFGFLAPEAMELLSRVQRVLHSNVMTPRSTNVVFNVLALQFKKG